MQDFSVAFKVVSELNCPYYGAEDLIVLSSQAVQVPIGIPSCLILVREVTNLLFNTIVPAAASGFEELKSKTYSCGGCTGLIKFQIEGNADALLQQFSDSEEDSQEMGSGYDLGPQNGEPDGVIVSGLISEISPSELMQFFHMHQKTGKLILDMTTGTGRIAFREGAIIGAKFQEYDDKEAIFALLREKQGRFSFISGIPSSLHDVGDIGDFMMLLMEGIKRMDEEEGSV